MAGSVSFGQLKANSNFEHATVFDLESEEGIEAILGKRINSCSMPIYLFLPYMFTFLNPLLNYHCY